MVVSNTLEQYASKWESSPKKQCWTFWNHHLFKCFTFQLSLGVLHQNSSLGVVNCPPRTMPPPRPQTGAAQGAASSWDVLTSHGMFSSHVVVGRKEIGKVKKQTKTPQSHPKQNLLKEGWFLCGLYYHSTSMIDVGIIPVTKDPVCWCKHLWSLVQCGWPIFCHPSLCQLLFSIL